MGEFESVTLFNNYPNYVAVCIEARTKIDRGIAHKEVSIMLRTRGDKVRYLVSSFTCGGTCYAPLKMSLRKRTATTKSSVNFFGEDPLELENNPEKLSTLRKWYIVAIIGFVVVRSNVNNYTVTINSHVNSSLQLIVYLKAQKEDEPIEAFVPIVDDQYNPENLFDWEPREAVVGDEELLGEMGKPVVISDKKRMEELFKEHEFNVMASDMISLNRSIPDTRNPK